MKSAASGGRPALPRSVIYLVVILLAALAVLVWLRTRPQAPDFTLGGPLFTMPADEIQGLLLTRGGAQYRLDRLPSGQWTLSGAMEDYLDTRSMESLLASLTAATGGRLIAGSEPEDRRYDFNGLEANRLTVFGAQGRTEKVVLGARNPVTGGWYASGAGRSACFPVSQGFREVLLGIPDKQRLQKLLPLADVHSVARVEIDRGENTDLLVKQRGNWFLQRQDGALLGASLRAYESFYSDRALDQDGRNWVLADQERVDLLIFECSQVRAQRYLPPGDAARLLASFDNDRPWRRIRLYGEGINPDPGEGSPDELELTLYLAADNKSQPVRRRGTVIDAEVEAANTISQPLSHLVNLRALGFRTGLADSLLIYRDGELLARMIRDEAGSAIPGRIQRRPVDDWLLDLPSPADTGQRPLIHHGQATHFLVDLNRLSILKTLPATRSAEVLRDKERLKLVFHFPEDSAGPAVGFPGVARGRVELHLGFLNGANLPPGSPAPASPDDALEPVGLWRPDTGQLLQIPGHPISTARAWALTW
jgi:hypothetical protein